MTSLSEKRLFVLFSCLIINLFLVGSSGKGDYNSNPLPFLGILICLIFSISLTILQISDIEFNINKIIWSNEPLFYAICSISTLLSFTTYIVFVLQGSGNEYFVSDLISPLLLVCISLVLITNKDFKSDRWLTIKYFYDDIQEARSGELCAFYLSVGDQEELQLQLSEDFMTKDKFSNIQSLDYTNLPMLAKDNNSGHIKKYRPITREEFLSLGRDYVISNQIMNRVIENSKCMLMVLTLLYSYKESNRFTIGNNTNKDSTLIINDAHISFCWTYQEILENSRTIMNFLLNPKKEGNGVIDFSKYFEVELNKESKLYSMFLLAHLYLLSGAKIQNINKSYWRAINLSLSNSANIVLSPDFIEKLTPLCTKNDHLMDVSDIRDFTNKIDSILLDPVDNFVQVYDLLCNYIDSPERIVDNIDETSDSPSEEITEVFENLLDEMAKSISSSKDIALDLGIDQLEVRKYIISAKAIVLYCLLEGVGLY